MEDSRPIKELAGAFYKALVEAGYSKSRLENFRTVIKRLVLYMNEKNITFYSASVGGAFLQKYYPVECDELPVHKLSGTIQYANRTIALLNDFQVHGAFLRADRVSRNPHMTPEFQRLSEQFGEDCRKHGTSESTVYRRNSDLRRFFHYLYSNQIDISRINKDIVTGFLGTIITLSDDTVEHHRRSLSQFLQFLFHNGYVKEDFSLNMPAKRSLRKNPLPSVWDNGDVEKLLSAVDRGSPMGKRDYAILLLVTKLGLRISDIRKLCLGDIDWENNRISFVQSKTQKRLELPLPPDIGWAIIDYLRYGRPKTEVSNIFLTCSAPIKALADANSLGEMIKKYARLAKIDISNHKHGAHSLRHTLATRLMEEEVPLSTIAHILGHSTTDTLKKYLQVDIAHLRSCALDVE